jgi:hypothetical protein
MDGFTHIAPKKPEKGSLMEGVLARRSAISDELADKLEDMSFQEQLDTLYTAVIDGDKEKIKQIQEIQNDEDKDVDVFTPEAVTKIRDAALKVAATQEVAKKIIIEKGVKVAEKEFKVEASVNQSKSQGR